MKKGSKIASLCLAGIMAFSLAACGSKEEKQAESQQTSNSISSEEAASDEKVYEIGVLQLMQHTALDASNKGFFAALDDAGIKYNADQQNAAGEQSTCQTVAEKFVNDKKDLIFAIATPAAQAVAGATTDIPVIVTAVTDPAESGLVESNEEPGGNVTGTSDLTPVKEQINLLKKIVPDAKKVGLFYCSAEANSLIQIEIAKEACKELGIETVDYTMSNSNELQTVLESMIGKVDALYSPTDNMVANGMSTIAMIAEENKLPTIMGESNLVDAGCLATYGIDYYEIGYLAGQQAAEILKGNAQPATTPIGYLPVDKCKIAVNEETAEKIGVDVSNIK